MRRSTLLVAIAAVTVSAVLIAVIAITSDPAGGRKSSDPSASTTPGRGCGAGTGSPSTRARVILDCVAPSLAFVSTPLGTGSGILVDGGYVVTNAHVVDPFGAVDLVFGATEHHRDVPVYGVDLTADLAIVGPVKTDRRSIAIADFDRLRRGDDLYLVGYPGEVDEEPQATISRGILSRTRNAGDYGLTFLQTDASIGGGQSGGAMVDDRGEVVGVSGFSFAEEFALALSGRDTRRSIRRILEHSTAPYRPFPDKGSKKGELALADSEAVQVLTLHTGAKAEQVRLSVPAGIRPAVVASDVEQNDVYFQNQEAVDAAAEADGGGGSDSGSDGSTGTDSGPGPGPVDVPAAPGVFEFEVPGDTYALILVGTRLPEGARATYTSNVALGRYDDIDDNHPIAVGDRVTGQIDPLEMGGDTYLVNLDAGETVEIFAGSATGDVGYSVREPGQKVADATYVDDSGLGLFGADASDTFRAETAGMHRLTVYSADGTATGYVLEIQPG